MPPRAGFVGRVRTQAIDVVRMLRPRPAEAMFAPIYPVEPSPPGTSTDSAPPAGRVVQLPTSARPNVHR